MRSKTILKIAAFVVAFGFSTAVANLFIPETQVKTNYVILNEHNSTSYFTRKNNSAAAGKISALIRADARNGQKRDDNLDGSDENVTSPFTSSSFPAYAGVIEQYVDDSSSIKTSGLPNDFQIAWREHMKAWRDCAEFLNKMKKSSIRDSWTDEEFRDIDGFHNQEISRTWYEVLRIAEEYGADVPE